MTHLDAEEEGNKMYGDVEALRMKTCELTRNIRTLEESDIETSVMQTGPETIDVGIAVSTNTDDVVNQLTPQLITAQSHPSIIPTSIDGLPTTNSNGN